VRKSKQEKYAYDVRVALWLRRDPIKERGGLNLYGMVNNDLVNHWDYLGLQISGIWGNPDQCLDYVISVEINNAEAEKNCPNGKIMFSQTVRSGGFTTRKEYGTLWRQIFGLRGSNSWEWDTSNRKQGHYEIPENVMAPDRKTGKTKVYPSMEDNPGGMVDKQMEFVAVIHCVCPKEKGLGRALGQISWGFSHKNGKLFVWGLRKGS